MENKNKNTADDFHALEFMREARNELTEQLIADKQKYLEYLKKVMEDFKLRQIKKEK